MITQSQIEGLAKQVFIVEYLLNGLFPCQSDVVRLIRSKKKEWNFNDKFEYRMLLATTNTGGSLNSQVFKDNVSLQKPGKLEYGHFMATYGSVSDGFDVDMTLNLETEDKKAAFENDFATRMHSLRTNVAALFKNFAIHGKFGVVHQLRRCIEAPNISGSYNPVGNTGHTPTIGVPFTIKTPINVFNSNFKQGKYLIKTKEARPDGEANVAEIYLVLDNQPNRLSLVAVGTAVSEWKNGEFLEVAQNREIAGMPPNAFGNWSSNGLTLSSPAGTHVIWEGMAVDKFLATGTYTNGENAIVGAMEGLADLFPWYCSVPDNPATPADDKATAERIGLDMPFRGQENRLIYSTEQCGGFVMQEDGEHIIDAIMRGVFLTKSTVPFSDITMFMNPVTRAEMGYEEAGNVRVIRDNLMAGPIIYQRGIKEVDFQVGNSIINNVVEDMNMPTDVILIGPKNDMSYNCWDNATFEIDKYIQETWAGQEFPKIEELSIPNELIAKMDLSQRITYGAPTLSDGAMPNFTGSGIRHPKNTMPVALHEMGALFTEYPYTYTVVKLQQPICELKTT